MSFATVTGSARKAGSYESVRFTVRAEVEAGTGPAAKEALRPAYDRVRAAIAKLEAEGLAVVEGSRKATNAVTFVEQYHRAGEPLNPPRYSATYVLSFSTNDAEKASIAHGALTSLEGVTVPNPEFVLACSEDLEQQALTEAVAAARASFARQCVALGVDTDRFEIISVSVNDRDRRHVSHGVQMSLGLESFTEGAPPIEVEPDKPEIICDVTLTYALKGSAAA